MKSRETQFVLVNRAHQFLSGAVSIFNTGGNMKIWTQWCDTNLKKHVSQFLQATVFLTAVATTACSNIYVGNVGFTAKEVCSSEYATSWWSRENNCLPPARVANAQSYFFGSLRPMLSPEEASLVEQAASSVSGVASKPNMLPSIVGRVFRAREHGDREALVLDEHGNMEFVPASGALNDVPTELQVSTNLSGMILKKVNVDAELDIGQLLTDALKTQGISFGALSNELKDKLVAQFNYARQSSNAARGSYYYVSMKPTEIDLLISRLRSKKLVLNQSADWRTVKAEAVFGYDGLSGIPSFESENVSAMPSVSVSNVAEVSGVKGVYGLIIGAAIIRTKAGHSTLCSQFGANTIGADASTTACSDLKNALAQTVMEVAASKPTSAVQQAALAASSVTAGSVLSSLSVGYARSAYKEMDINDHASVLAIQWIPIRLGQ